MSQKVKHSKIKNTGILFELLSRQITVDVMNDDGKSRAVEMLKKFFNEESELGELLDGDNIKADFKDGVLSVSIPKVEPKKPKKHTVKIG